VSRFKEAFITADEINFTANARFRRKTSSIHQFLTQNCGVLMKKFISFAIELSLMMNNVNEIVANEQLCRAPDSIFHRHPLNE